MARRLVKWTDSERERVARAWAVALKGNDSLSLEAGVAAAVQCLPTSRHRAVASMLLDHRLRHQMEEFRRDDSATPRPPASASPIDSAIAALVERALGPLREELSALRAKLDGFMQAGAPRSASMLAVRAGAIDAAPAAPATAKADAPRPELLRIAVAGLLPGQFHEVAAQTNGKARLIMVPGFQSGSEGAIRFPSRADFCVLNTRFVRHAHTDEAFKRFGRHRVRLVSGGIRAVLGQVLELISGKVAS